MTREQLEARIKLLTESYERILVNLNAHKGAIEECQYWLEQLDKADKEDDTSNEAITTSSVPVSASPFIRRS